MAVGAMFWHVRLRVHGRDNALLVGHGSSLRNVRVRIVGDGNRIEIGEYVRFTGHLLVMGNHNVIWVGDRTYVGGAELAAAQSASIRIGEDCLLGDEVDVRSGDFRSIIDATTGERLNPPSDVVIGDRVWVGKRAMLMKGSRIGSGSIVGAGSLVTGEVPSDVVAAGVPAKVIRTGVAWRHERMDSRNGQASGTQEDAEECAPPKGTVPKGTARCPETHRRG